MRSFLSSEIEESRSCRVNESAREKKRERIGEIERVIFVHFKNTVKSNTHTTTQNTRTHTREKYVQEAVQFDRDAADDKQKAAAAAAAPSLLKTLLERVLRNLLF